MISVEQLSEMDKKLYVYDVEQGAWEQEPNDFEANATHVLTHLTKDVMSKDFNDPGTARNQIAPDSLQYALRLVRWSNQDPETIIDTRDTARAQVRSLSRKLGSLPLAQVAFMEAAATMARNIHDLGHNSTMAEANKQKPAMARSAAGLLIYCAELQSWQYDFDVELAFTDRLSGLRERFGIPVPDKV